MLILIEDKVIYSQQGLINKTFLAMSRKNTCREKPIIIHNGKMKTKSDSIYFFIFPLLELNPPNERNLEANYHDCIYGKIKEK